MEAKKTTRCSTIVASLMDEVICELEEKNKRNRILVIHNLPECNKQDDEVANVSKLIEEILQDEHTCEYEVDGISKQPRIYRLGNKSPHKVRSLKVHLKSSEMRDKILDNEQKLATSSSYQRVVIKKDMIPLERTYIKTLVSEKKIRNHEAKSKQEVEERRRRRTWTIPGGIMLDRRPSSGSCVTSSMNEAAYGG